MKKLMIAAALAAAFIGTASADCADPTPCEKCLFGYKLQLVAKTTVAASVSNVYAHACGCYRKPTMGKIVGYIFGKTAAGTGTCGDTTCGCNDFTNDTNEKSFILLWKAWNGAAVSTDGASFSQLDRIGYKDRSTAEILWSISLTDPSASSGDSAKLALAGFGKCAHRADGTVAIKNANGFFVGQMYSYCQESIEQQCGDPIPGEAVASHCWTLCEGTVEKPEEIEDQNLTVAYGKWQMVWDSQLLDRFAKSGVNSNTARPSSRYQQQTFSWDE